MSDQKKPCLHCMIGRMIKEYTIEYKIEDAQYVIDMLSDVMGDLLGGASKDSSEWPEILMEFNTMALKRALTAVEHWEARQKKQ